jgi:hypothetical protein
VSGRAASAARTGKSAITDPRQARACPHGCSSIWFDGYGRPWRSWPTGEISAGCC